MVIFVLRAKRAVLAVIPIATETMAGVRAPSKTCHGTRWIDLDRQSNDTFRRLFNGWQMMVAAMVAQNLKPYGSKDASD